jgi:hypothetical protein
MKQYCKVDNYDMIENDRIALLYNRNFLLEGIYVENVNFMIMIWYSGHIQLKNLTKRTYTDIDIEKDLDFLKKVFMR